MQFTSLLKLGTGLALATSLAACGGGSSDSPTPPTPTPTTPATLSVEARIGAAFATVFDAATTGEPVDPNDQSVPALAPASEPLDF